MGSGTAGAAGTEGSETSHQYAVSRMGWYRAVRAVPAFEAMEHNGFDTMEHNGQGVGEGAGKGMGLGDGRPGKGMGRGQSGFGEDRGRGQGDPGFDMNQAPQGLSIGSAVSTFAAYASILYWFAIVTAVLSAWVRKLLHANKSKE